MLATFQGYHGQSGGESPSIARHAGNSAVVPYFRRKPVTGSTLV